MLQSINDWFRNLNLKNKLAVLVTLMTIFLIFVGLIGLHASYIENKRLVDLYQNRLIAYKLIQEIIVNTRANEANIYKLAFFPKSQNQTLMDINIRSNKWQSLLNEYMRTNSDPYEKAQLQIISKDTSKYIEEKNTSINLITNGKKVEGIKHYRLLLPILNDINKKLTNLADYNTKMAKIDYENSIKQTRINYLFILGSILLAIPLAISLLMLISSTITKPIMTLVDKMKQVASGKLDTEPAESKYKNEIGDLNNSFNIMTNKLRYLIEKETNTSEREKFLRHIVLTSITTLQTNKVLKTVVIETGKRFNAARCYFIRYDSNTQSFLPIHEYELYISSLEHKDLTGKIIEKDELEPFLKILLGQNQELIVNDVSTLSLPDKTKQFFENYEIESFIAAPVFFQNIPMGILFVDFSNTERELTNEDAELLAVIANQSAIVVNQTRLFQEVQSARDGEALLRTIIDTIRGSLNINEIKTNLVKEIGKAFDADRCTIQEFDPIKNIFLPVDEWSEYLSSGNNQSFIGKEVSSQEQEYYSYFIKDQKSEICFNNIDEYIKQQNIQSTELINIVKKFKIVSAFIIPIIYLNQLLGIFAIHYTHVKDLNEDKKKFVRAAANQAGIGLYQARLYNISQKNEKRESTLRKVISTVRGTLDINETLQIISEEVSKLFNAERVIILHYPDPQNYSLWELESDYINSPGMISSKDAPLKPEAGIYWGNFILNKGQILAIDDVQDANISEFLKYNCQILGIRALTGIPIRKGDNIWGTLSIAMSTPRHWSEDELSLLTPISDQIYSAINQAELYSTTKQSAERESLLRTINNQILASQNVEEATNSIVDEIGKIYNIDRVVLRFYEPAIRSFSEVKGEYKRNESIPSTLGKNPYSREINEYLINEIESKKQIIPIENIDKAEIPEYLREYFKNLKIKSTFMAPILYGNTILGLIFLTNTESFKTWNQKDIELFQDIATQISIGIHMFNLTDKLSKSLESERVAREIIFETRELENHDTIFNYMLKRLLDIFYVKRVIHLHYDKYRNLTVTNEALIDQKLNSLCNQPILFAECTGELEPETFGDVILINDVQSEIKDNLLKDFFKNKNILAFMIYPVAKRGAKEEDQDIIATTMLCSTVPRIWTQSEIDNFKLIVDATSLVFLELKQRQETEETRNTFLATLTHDLRSPLNAEQKALEAIISKKFGTSLEGFSEYLKDMYKTNQELLRIVNNILSVYHYEEGNFELKLEQTDITDLINNSINIMYPLARDQNSNINTNIDPALPPVMIDRNEILRVINNLISNAIKHNKKGTNINITGKKVNNEVQISVQDNGKGISEKEKKNIFQRYPTAKRKIGTGLGLYLSKQIIDAHKGKIWFESEEGKGTTFYFTLPIYKTKR